MTFSLKVAFSFLQLKIGSSYKSIDLCWTSTFFFSISSCRYLLLMLFVSIPVLDVGRILGKAVCCPWDVRLHHRLDHLWGDYISFQNVFCCYFLAFLAFLNTINVLYSSVYCVDCCWRFVCTLTKLTWVKRRRICFPFFWTSMMCHCWIGKWLAGRTKSSSNMISWKGRQGERSRKICFSHKSRKIKADKEP